ncbi:uncharacterized protein THITE_2054654 [Thermothielavioides terrestris NRRL 8126]|uniref:Serine hydrolase domain-containing protein n=1 Tax=Thermothielavioides terrestris (strain ATCC 38088 / NRRL 8126) TaxID=578455 RepID=G2R9P7_THETT|nr:uncharacterized protein THITE_2054654 [Thermothielavioides terrestris NRRL 8126]AEO68735.1 hypothetical protein THITE_2054654 [Thermothielavioides terrestris NRRL 8126]
MPTPSPPKPILVFLHGAGTSASIFRLQSRRLAAQLSPHFDLVYLDAPHACPAGPGVLPFFEGCGPYLRWVDDEAPERERAYWAEGEGGDVDRLVREVRGLGSSGGSGRRRVVGVVGFSQGAKVGMEVVRRLEGMGRMGEEEEGNGVDVKVVVAVCGTAPFQGGGDEREKGFRGSLEKGVVKAASVHLIGEDDPWRPESEKLVEFFDEARRKVIVFEGGHQMPAAEWVNTQAVRVVLDACGL